MYDDGATIVDVRLVIIATLPADGGDLRPDATQFAKLLIRRHTSTIAEGAFLSHVDRPVVDTEDVAVLNRDGACQRPASRAAFENPDAVRGPYRGHRAIQRHGDWPLFGWQLFGKNSSVDPPARGVALEDVNSVDAIVLCVDGALCARQQRPAVDGHAGIDMRELSFGNPGQWQIEILRRHQQGPRPGRAREENQGRHWQPSEPTRAVFMANLLAGRES